MKQKLLFILFVFGMSLQLSAQVVAGIPDDLIECDVNNPGDQIEVFDLTETEKQIINGQSNVVVSYHPTSGDALGNNNAFPNPENFTNTANPQLIFARLQSTNGQGWEVVSFQIIVPLIPEVVNPPVDVEIVEGDGNGRAIFDLTVNEDAVLGDQDPFLFQFSYYRSQEDAEMYDNAIVEPETYQNESNPQLIYGRMDPEQIGCDYELFSFEISTDGTFGVAEVATVRPWLETTIVHDKLTFQLEEGHRSASVTILNMQGKTLRVSRLEGNRPTLSVSELASGVYFVQIQSHGISETQRFIKQ